MVLLLTGNRIVQLLTLLGNLEQIIIIFFFTVFLM